MTVPSRDEARRGLRPAGWAPAGHCGTNRDRHAAMGSILLAAGVTLAVEGCFSTWWRVGELFPGEHIFAGAATTLSWVRSPHVSLPQQGRTGPRKQPSGLAGSRLFAARRIHRAAAVKNRARQFLRAALRRGRHFCNSGQIPAKHTTIPRSENLSNSLFVRCMRSN